VLLTNARIYTMDRANSVVDTLMVRDGRIVFAGRRTDVNVPDSEESIDLGGRAVLPGLVDGHAHLYNLARLRLSLNVAGILSEDEIALLVGDAAANTRPGDWISGRGWDQNLWPGKRFPSKASLDRAAPNAPVILKRVDGHAIWANSAALKAAGVTRDTPDPDGGIVVKDENGEPTGILIDTAQWLVERVEPRPSQDRFDRAVEEAIAECLSKGLTGIHEMGVGLFGLASYKRLIERGRFPFRNYAAVDGDSTKAWGFYRERGREEQGDGRLVVRSLKLYSDGALGSRGAALHEPYCDAPATTGLVRTPPDELERLTREAAERGFQVCVHAIGDRANTLTLDTFETVLAERPGPDHRFRVEHAQILTEHDIPRFRRLGVLPSMQATHCTSDMPWAEERLGPERLKGAYAWRTLLNTGVVIPGGSDFPVEDPNPVHGIYASVARRSLSSPPRIGEGLGVGSGWQPEQRMTREEAVRSFTIWNAYGSFQEADLGSIEPGKRADLVVLSDDVFTCAEERIKDIRPMLTMVDGQVGFQAQPVV
jgi:predicted amidohydrolase YtcJ